MSGAGAAPSLPGSHGAVASTHDSDLGTAAPAVRNAVGTGYPKGGAPSCSSARCRAEFSGRRSAAQATQGSSCGVTPPPTACRRQGRSSGRIARWRRDAETSQARRATERKPVDGNRGGSGAECARPFVEVTSARVPSSFAAAARAAVPSRPIARRWRRASTAPSNCGFTLPVAPSAGSRCATRRRITSSWSLRTLARSTTGRFAA